MKKRKNRTPVSKRGSYRRPSHWIALAVIFAALVVAAVIALLQMRASREEIIVEASRYAAKHKLPVEFVCSVIEQESGFDVLATGKAGEIGLMQLMPPGKPGAPEEWARIYKIQCPSRWKLYRVDTNINIGCWYLARAIKKWRRYRGCFELALIEYNAGAKYANLYKPENLDGDVISRIKIASTKKYVCEVMARYRRYLNANAPAAEK